MPESMTSVAGGRLKVVVDASPLRDGRGQAGIGRYVSSMLTELREMDELDLHPMTSPLPPPQDSWVVRWLSAQPGLAAARLLHRDALLHGMASEVAFAWPPERQVVTVHDVIPWSIDVGSGTTRRHLDAQAARLRRCAAVIAISETVREEALEALQLDPSRVQVVPEGVDAIFDASPQSHDHAIRRRLGAPDGDYVLWVGSLRHRDPRKALDVLLEAAVQAPKATLVMAGAPGEESRRLLAAAADWGLRLVLPGFVPDAELAALYRGAAVVVLPSLHEGFGLPVLEALASGAPVIASNAGNLSSLVKDAAILVPPGNAGLLGGAIGELLDSPDERHRLAAAGPAVAARYSWSRAAEMTVAVYRGALEAN